MASAGNDLPMAPKVHMMLHNSEIALYSHFLGDKEADDASWKREMEKVISGYLEATIKVLNIWFIYVNQLIK